MRTSLALSAAIRQPVHIFNIRAKRPKPGLRPQHLTCVKAAQAICSAEVEGAYIGSQELLFNPHETTSGNYSFDIGTAGSTMLVFQTVLLPLALCTTPSVVRLTGGTHVPWSPHFHYVQEVFLPACARAGIDVSMSIKKWGWYPKGGGRVEAHIRPWKERASFDFVQPTGKKSLNIKAVSAVSMLPRHVMRRQAEQLARRLEEAGAAIEVEKIYARADCPGSLAFCWISGHPGCYAGFTGLGARGKPAEKVADEAADAMLSFLESGASVDARLADQLVTVAALTRQSCAWVTQRLTGHLETNCWVVEQFGLGRFDFSRKGRGVGVIFEC